ncbi:hypothetical protein Pint_08072 [Pistacia integerrima]|uniref:Uncharacterized protein n=1 Tax=Pistacia integerrima TaxID=434235 RepID=A0ACC0XXN5_9ROSI|nr:hypothetical protein Pint_08072 [Pistacia integerrima]
MISWSLESDAQLWLQVLKKELGGELITWQQLVDELFKTYGSTCYQDFFDELTKLQQTSTVKRRVLRINVQACKPTTLSSAIGLARLYEARNQAKRGSPNHARKTINNQPSPNKSSLPVKMLLADEIVEHRVKGFCYNCNEKWGPGHRCKKLFLLEAVEEDEKEQEDDVVITWVDDMPEISIHAMCGSNAPQTMRVMGRIVRQGYKPSSEGKFEMAVVSGEKLSSPGQCKGICMRMQKVTLTVDFYILPLEGYDAVLGAQWLSTLGPIVWDFSKLQMMFKSGDKKVLLQGLKSTHDKLIDGEKFSKKLKKNKEGLDKPIRKQ